MPVGRVGTDDAEVEVEEEEEEEEEEVEEEEEEVDEEDSTCRGSILLGMVIEETDACCPKVPVISSLRNFPQLRNNLDRSSTVFLNSDSDRVV